jgi:hypothetical protein
MTDEAMRARAREIAHPVSYCHFDVRGVHRPECDLLTERILAAFREAIAEERERCAEIAENYSDPNPFPTTMGAIAAAIRAREEPKP